MAPPIRVFLIDDSAVVRGALRRIIEAEPDLVVVGTAANGRMGLEAVVALDTAPDVVLLDIEMPELDGLATLPPLLERMPGLKVIMASSLTQRGARVTLEALALGAADYIAKPTARAGPEALAPVAAQLLEKIRGLARVPRRASPTASPASSSIASSVPPFAASPTHPSASASHAPTVPRRPALPPEIIAIAASTGGPNALVTLLRALPRELQIPIVITQHMPPLFTTLLAQRLERESGRRCVEAVDGMAIAPGHVYIAPGDYHLLVAAAGTGWQLRLSQTPAENHCRPAADPMFRSVSAAFGSRVLALVLTGMGEDGRRGCEVIHRNGGRILVQDEATSVVWGMPGAVVAAGCADAVLPIPEMAHRIAHLELVLQ